MTGRRGFAIEITSLARARMSASERSEVFAWASERGVRVYIWYRANDRRYEADLTKGDANVSARSNVSPFEAFHAAKSMWDTPVISLFTGPAA